MKKIIVRTTFGAFLIAAFALGQTGPAGWKGTIATENGVKVVRNPVEPLYGTFAFDLEEDLVLGGNPTKEDYYFPKGGNVSVDDSGRIYVADVGNRRVQLYDHEGKFLRTIGRQGQGPGEYQYPSLVLFDGEGNIYIRGARELVVFAPDGGFKKKVTLRTFLNRLTIGSGGAVVGTTQPGPRDAWKQQIVLVDSEGTSARTIAEFRGELAESLKGFVLHWYSSTVVFSPHLVDTFAYGFSSDYRLYVSDATGRTIGIFTKDEKPLSISGKEKEATRKDGYYVWYGQTDKPGEDAVFPDHRPFFTAIQNDDLGRLYVIRTRSILEKDGAQTVDVFSKEGIYLYRMSWPFVPAVIKNGAVYRIKTDKDSGEYFIVRLRIKNWDQMKT